MSRLDGEEAARSPAALGSGLPRPHLGGAFVTLLGARYTRPGTYCLESPHSWFKPGHLPRPSHPGSNALPEEGSGLVKAGDSLRPGLASPGLEAYFSCLLLLKHSLSLEGLRVSLAP